MFSKFQTAKRKFEHIVKCSSSSNANSRFSGSCWISEVLHCGVYRYHLASNTGSLASNGHPQNNSSMNWFNPRKRYGLEFHLFIVQKSPPTIEYVHSDPDGDGGGMPRDISSITGTVPGPGRDLAHFRTTATMEVWRCTREVLDREA